MPFFQMFSHLRLFYIYTVYFLNIYIYKYIYMYNIDVSLDDYGKVYGTSLCVSSCFSEFLIQFREIGFIGSASCWGGRKMAAFG